MMTFAARNFTWMPNTLRAWGTEKGLPRKLEVENSTMTYNKSITRHPIQHTVLILVARYEDQIHAPHDHMDEIPLEILEAIEQDVEGVCADAEAVEQAVETLRETREQVADLHTQLEQSG